MKTIVSKYLVILILLALAFAPTIIRAQDAPPPPPDNQDDQGASFQTFYDQLGDQGNWIQTDDYGYVFQPNVTDPNWAPYTDGHWVNTDQGWMWVSDESWGWATYHYGRWANIDGTGWVWVPGYQWAPAWVSWRYGGGYCGWAPLPPATFVGVEYGSPGVSFGGGFHFGGDVDVSFGIGAGCYNFVNVGDFGEYNYRGHYLDRGRNFAVINNTTNITNINVNKTVINNGTINNFHGVSVGGPQLSEINAHSRQHVQTVQLTAANQPGRSTLQGNTLSVYAPHVNPATQHQARPTQVARTIAHPTINRGVSITKPLQVTEAVKPAAPSAEAIQAAKTAELHVPAQAKIATAKTVPTTTLNKPLTSMEPVRPTHAVSNATGAGVNTYKPNVEQHSATTSPYTGEPVNPKPNVEQHSATTSPYTGEPVNPKPNVEHSAVTSPSTGESSNSQAALAQQRKLEQEREQRTESLQKERESESEPVHQAPPQHTAVQQQQQQQVVHPQSQPVYHPQPQPQQKPAPQQQPAAKKENNNNNGQGGPGNPNGH